MNRKTDQKSWFSVCGKRPKKKTFGFRLATLELLHERVISMRQASHQLKNMTLLPPSKRNLAKPVLSTDCSIVSTVSMAKYRNMKYRIFDI